MLRQQTEKVAESTGFGIKCRNCSDVPQMNLLSEGGKMILAFKDCDTYDKTVYDWICDWQFIERSERQVFDLLGDSGISEDALAVSRDASGIILFCVITKK